MGWDKKQEKPSNKKRSTKGWTMKVYYGNMGGGGGESTREKGRTTVTEQQLKIK